MEIVAEVIDKLPGLVDQVIAAGPAAIGVLRQIAAAGLDTAEVAAAVEAAIAPPAVPELPPPADCAPVFAYLEDGQGDPNPNNPLLAAMAAIEAQNWDATAIALMDLYRSARRAKPEMEHLYAQFKERANAADGD